MSAPSTEWRDSWFPLWPSPKNYSRSSESLCLFHLNVWHPRWPRHMGWQFGSEVQSNERGGWAPDAASDGLISEKKRVWKAWVTKVHPGMITCTAAQISALRVWSSKFKFKATRGSCRVCDLQTIWNRVNLDTGLVLKHSMDVGLF